MLFDVLQRNWDVVVVGAGLGGGTAGRRLAEMGWSVLFLEKGPFEDLQAAETTAERDALDRKFWAPPLYARIDGKFHLLEGAIGSGVGGSSLLYAASFERPERSDMEDSLERPHPTGGWPVGYDAFLPYFAEVERRFSVRGTANPLSSDNQSLLPPPPLRKVDAVMAEVFARHGLHPYQVHQALRDLDNCQNCFGRVCRRGCKMDGRTAGVLPALACGNCAVIDHCTVVALRGEPGRVTYLEIERQGERAEVRAKRYVLAGGGFGSPQLLMASKSDYWPNGCGNRSGLVGRNLMFHLLESIAIWPGRRLKPTGPSKALTVRDLYYDDGKRYGLLQSSGLDAGYGEVLHALRQRFEGGLFGPGGLLRKLANLPVWLATTLLGTAKVYRAIIEDLPYPENRVVFDPREPSRIAFEYTVHDELKARQLGFRTMLRKHLKLPMMFLTSGLELDLSHVCGTLRFGDDPNSSVLNAECRVHDIENLYVADASFMPTSCGVNPGLLVAANAMRVADAVSASLKQA
ncbi:MAG: glucose-methanol-choline oxidoreductase [Pelagibacterium sp. SCN 63-23]|nr:MAG: glucose-methanol-choline oxidoreductase [Pelagibacterium sp. SCN 63-23]